MDKHADFERIADFAASFVTRTDCLIGLTTAIAALVKKYQSVEIDRNERKTSTE